jgi:hypothetical protein
MSRDDSEEDSLGNRAFILRLRVNGFRGHMIINTSAKYQINLKEPEKELQ